MGYGLFQNNLCRILLEQYTILNTAAYSGIKRKEIANTADTEKGIKRIEKFTENSLAKKTKDAIMMTK